MTSLSDRLSKLGVKKGNEIAIPNYSRFSSLRQLLDAEECENRLGKVLVIKKLFPYGYSHGDINFQKFETNIAIQKAGKIEKPSENLQKLIFLDTETTGLSGGTGTIAFLIGLAQFDDQGLVLTQLIVEDPSDEAAMLAELTNLTSQVNAVVTFNGKSFDLPLLKTRFILNRLPVPFATWAHLDLLHISRKIWKRRLAKRSLKDLENEILHVPRTDEEVPGWIIPEIYFNFLRSGDSSQIANVVYHNAMDIVSLAALFIHINSMLDRNQFPLNLHQEDMFSIGQLFESICETNRALDVYVLCKSLFSNDPSLLISLNNRIANIYKKQNLFENALPLWKQNSEEGDYFSSIELAKYYEHSEKKYLEAMHWTLKAEQNLSKLNISRYKMKFHIKELNNRKLRLEKRSS